jgi:hypothetical protein
VTGIFEAIRRAARGQGESPWYHPEIGHYFADLRNGGHQAVRRFMDQEDSRVRRVDDDVHRQTGLGRPGEGPGGSMAGSRLETGHHVKLNLDYPSHTWYAAVSPPSYPRHSHEDAAFLHLGQDDERVPHMIRQRFQHPEVQQYLRDTMDR